MLPTHPSADNANHCFLMQSLLYTELTHFSFRFAMEHYQRLLKIRRFYPELRWWCPQCFLDQPFLSKLRLIYMGAMQSSKLQAHRSDCDVKSCSSPHVTPVTLALTYPLLSYGLKPWCPLAVVGIKVKVRVSHCDKSTSKRKTVPRNTEVNLCGQECKIGRACLFAPPAPTEGICEFTGLGPVEVSPVGLLRKCLS